jgi:hypothetical protein
MADSIPSGQATGAKVTYDSATDSHIDVTCDEGFKVAAEGSTEAPAASGGLVRFDVRVTRTTADPATRRECVISFTLPGTENFDKRVEVT